MSAEFIQVHFRQDFITEANAMNPDQTTPLPLEQSHLSPYYLQEHKQKKEQTTKSMTGGKLVENPLI